MQPKPKRSELDHLAQFHALDPQGVEALFTVSGARPSRQEGRRFLANCLRVAGVLSLAAGLVFFVAANWSEIEVFGRFALIQIFLLACCAVAFWKPPPEFVGRAALFLAFVATGALLALFGQTYQTGADVYELFLTWTLLGLPLVIAARWAVSSAAWVLVLNLTLLLYCGWQPAGGLLWALLGNTHFRPADLIICAAWLNLLLWFAAEWRRPEAVPDWARRLLVSCAFLFATWAGVLAVVDGDPYPLNAAQTAGRFITPLAWLAAIAAAVWFTLRRREDIYPLAVVMGSFTVVSMCWIADVLGSGADEGLFLMMAIYLVAISTASGKVLLTLHRRWRGEVA